MVEFLQETTVWDFVESLAEVEQYGIDLRLVIQSFSQVIGGKNKL